MVTFEYDEKSRILTCKFPSRLDTVNSPDIGRRVEAKLSELQSVAQSARPPQNFRVVFDMSGVGFISSAFLRICLSSAQGLPAGHFRIVNCTPLVKSTFEMAGMHKLFPIS